MPADVQRELATEPPFTRRRFNTSLEEKKRYLEQLARSKVLFEEARRQKLDQDPALVRRFRQMVVDTLIQKLREKITPETVTDAEVARFFEEHRGEYERPAMVRAAQILLGSRAEAEALRAELEAATGAERLQRFQGAAARKSLDEATRYRGGDLGFLSAGAPGAPAATANPVTASVLTAALALKTIGELAPVVEAGPGKWVVLMKTGERAEEKRKLEDLRISIRFRLVNERRGQVVEELLQKLQGGAMAIDEAALARLSAPEGETAGGGN